MCHMEIGDSIMSKNCFTGDQDHKEKCVSAVDMFLGGYAHAIHEMGRPERVKDDTQSDTYNVTLRIPVLIKLSLLTTFEMCSSAFGTRKRFPGYHAVASFKIRVKIVFI